MPLARKKNCSALEADARKIMDVRGGAVLPGLINTHTHAAMTLFRGLADDLPLKTWLEEIIFPAESRFVNPDSVYWGTLLACAEMLLSGTTTCADGYFCMDGSVKALDQSGMRGFYVREWSISPPPVSRTRPKISPPRNGMLKNGLVSLRVSNRGFSAILLMFARRKR